MIGDVKTLPAESTKIVLSVPACAELLLDFTVDVKAATALGTITANAPITATAASGHEYEFFFMKPSLFEKGISREIAQRFIHTSCTLCSQ